MHASIHDSQVKQQMESARSAESQFAGPPRRVNLLGVGVSAINMSRALDAIEYWISRRDRHYVCAASVNSLIEAQENQGLRRAYSSAGLVTPDGMPLVWLSRLMGYSEVARVCGPDLMLELCERSVLRGFRHYLFGSQATTTALLERSLKRRYPGLQIVGYGVPELIPGSLKYRTLDKEEDQALVNEINSYEPDIVWVGLGCPAQERWMADHVNRLDAPVLIGVGAAFDFHAGVRRRAPLWMRRSGLEWSFRVMCEPRRLWKRYLLGNCRFIYRSAVQLARKRPSQVGT
jgi:N-acetylglucosaminyldiphosphoundecaprenol N-acetyl-beta-D-mannosaminyltransferase